MAFHHRNFVKEKKLFKLYALVLLDTLVSGSPIIQNGKLIGAVTHVLVDDPTKGYAIFAENMLETANRVGTGVPDCPQDKQLKEVS